MNKLALALGLLLSAVAAEYTTTLLFVGLELDSQAIGGYVGSVIGTDATATTYSVTCPAFVGEGCGIPTSFTITQGLSTMHYAFPTGGSGDMTAGCKITTDHGVCSGSILAIGASGGSTTISYSSFGTDAGAVPITITAGMAPVATGSNDSIALTSATMTGAPAGQTAVSSRSDSGSPLRAGSSVATGSSSSSLVSKASTGGVPLITGHAQWVIGGAGAAVAIAAM